MKLTKQNKALKAEFERQVAIEALERAVIDAAEKLADGDPGTGSGAFLRVLRAVDALRAARQT